MYHFFKDAAGSAFLETSIAIPFLIIPLGFGALEVSYVIYQMQQVKSGLADGCRYLAHVPYAKHGTIVIAPDTYSDFSKKIAVNGGSVFTNTPTPRISGWATQNVLVTYPVLITNSKTNGYSSYHGFDDVRVVRLASEFTPQGFGFLKIIGGFFGKSLNWPDIRIYHDERVIGE